MSDVLVYQASGDPALATAGVVAGWTTDRLRREFHTVTVLTDAGRAALDEALPAVDGLAAFSHGSAYALLDGRGSPVLDAANIHLVAGRWLWLFACRTATELASHACEAGATCFAGFEVGVIVEWDEADLGDLREVFERLVTEVPSHLAAGRLDEHALRAALVPLVDTILDFVADRPAAPAGIEITAQQMLHRLILRPECP